MTQILEILKKSRERLTDPDLWCQDNVSGVNNLPDGRQARCILVTMDHVQVELNAEYRELVACRDLVRNKTGMMVSTWNDDPERKHADILAVLDELIESHPL